MFTNHPQLLSYLQTSPYYPNKYNQILTTTLKHKIGTNKNIVGHEVAGVSMILPEDYGKTMFHQYKIFCKGSCVVKAYPEEFICSSSCNNWVETKLL